MRDGTERTDRISTVFADLLCGDSELVDAEFAGIVAANFAENPARWHVPTRTAVAAAGQARPAHPATVTRNRCTPRTRGNRGPVRQRSPPDRRTTTAPVARRR